MRLEDINKTKPQGSEYTEGNTIDNSGLNETRNKILSTITLRKNYYGYFTKTPYYQGINQGNPTSPLLCVLLLNKTLCQENRTLMYADDGLIYGEECVIKNS
jgi:hypothetical protein